MIITRLIGGLGNQLFQYAFGLHLAEESGQDLFIDVSAFETYQLHSQAIDRFAITAGRVAETHRGRIPGRYRGATRFREAIDRALGRLSGSLSAPLKLRREKPFGYKSEYRVPAADLYLDGYWQAEAFFPNMRTKLRDEFALVDPLTPQSRALAERMSEVESVALHVRRGDYVTNADTAKIYRTLDAVYYRRCLQDLLRHVSSPRVFLFSNDIDWCHKNLDVGVPFTPVTHNDASAAHEDLRLISQCRHAIIANSTFSWWGAFLGDAHPDRRVYYPKPWFNAGTLDDTAIGCQDWISEESLTHAPTTCSAA